MPLRSSSSGVWIVPAATTTIGARTSSGAPSRHPRPRAARAPALDDHPLHTRARDDACAGLLRRAAHT